MTDRTQRAIKDYNYWSVRLHGNQNYLGRCIIWCKREDIEDLSECTDAERDELFEIIKELKRAAEKLFQPDSLNYAFLGNMEPHLHGHFIPRYQNAREMFGMTFTDERWGDNYQTDPAFKATDEVVLKLSRRTKEFYKQKRFQLRLQAGNFCDEIDGLWHERRDHPSSR